MRALALLALAVVALVSAALWSGADRPASSATGPLASDVLAASPRDEAALSDARGGEAGTRAAAAAEPTTPTPALAGAGAASEDAGDGAGTLVVLTRRDEHPVADVAFAVLDATRGALVHRARTDERGRAELAPMAPGTYTVLTLRGPSKEVTVNAGETAEVALEFRRTLTVHGVVTTPDGRPVAGADVLVLSWRKDWLGTERAARTDADGRFEVPHVDARRSLGAVARGFGPAPPVDLELAELELDADGRAKAPLTLALEALGGEVVGVVTDPRGVPVVGARVAVGAVSDEYEMRNDTTTAESYGAHVAETDGAGRYALAGLPPGAAPVAVSADGFPIARASVDVVAGATATCDVALVTGLHVEGTVTVAAEGRDASGALVIALDAPFHDPFPSQGPTDRGAPFPRPRTRAAADGTYRLGPLPPGEVHLYAAKGTTSWDDRRGEFLGTAQVSMTGSDGDALTWNPTLSVGLRIHGRVTYADGTPLGNVFVSARTGEPEERGGRTEHAGEDGVFSISGLEDRDYTVHVQLWDAPAASRPLEQGGVRPSEAPLLLVADYSPAPKEAPGVVKVRLVDDANRVVGKGAVMFEYDRGRYYSDSRSGDGVFTAELPPGRYRPVAVSGDLDVGYGPEFTLAAGERRDLDDLRTFTPASLHVACERGALDVELAVYLEGAGSFRSNHYSRLEAAASELTFDDLPPGPYLLVAWGMGVAHSSREVALEAGVTTTARLTLDQGVHRELRVAGPLAPGWGRVEITVRDAATGSLRARQRYEERWVGANPIVYELMLPLGRFQVDARTEGGRSASATLEVTVLAAAEPLTLTLP